MNGGKLARATELLYAEAACLDSRDWDGWLALYSADCEYWVPAWKDEDTPTSDPERELSLIYYDSRAGLEDRVGRVKSARAVSSMVLPRTQHVLSNIRILQEQAGTVLVYSNWTVQQFQPKDRSVEVFFGHQEHLLRTDSDQWVIARRKIILLNDLLPAKLDFYNI